MGFWDDVNPQTVANASDGYSGEFKVGDNDAVIDLVEEGWSKSGNEMVIVQFKNETNAKIRFYIVNDEYKFQKIKQLQLAFGIPVGNTYFNGWVGKRGIVVCKQGKPYEGRVRNEVSYLRPKTSAPNNSAPAQGQTQPSMDPGYMTPKQPQQPPANSAPDDYFNDDIPF